MTTGPRSVSTSHVELLALAIELRHDRVPFIETTIRDLARTTLLNAAAWCRQMAEKDSPADPFFAANLTLYRAFLSL